ncbi:MAG: acyl-[acyl-carrier-protein] thioesterase [Lachnospiraceae bacterium]|nr:acyl-[acyl-carrier-protein] thioesterase [Lachnospiraceae bacterium]
MYSFDSRIRYSECDEKCKLRLESLLNYFQDASTFQSEELGVGFAYLVPKNLVWVLAAWQIEIYRYPALGEAVEIGTLPYDFKGFMGSRNFFMKTKTGEMLAQANSVWTLLNFDTMKPTIPTAEMLEKYPVEPRLEMEYAGRKILVPEGGYVEETVVIRKQHLDSNNHVNNSQYVSIAVNYLQEDYPIGGLRVEYKKQAHLGDELIPYVVKGESVIIVSLRDAQGNVYVNVEFRKAE